VVILFFSEQDAVEEICCFDFRVDLDGALECARIETRVNLEGNLSEAPAATGNVSAGGVAVAGISSAWIVKVVVAGGYQSGIIEDTGGGITKDVGVFQFKETSGTVLLDGVKGTIINVTEVGTVGLDSQ